MNPEISIVTSLYYSSEFIDEFYERILSQVKKLGLTYEILFVNDGSPDDSGSKAERIAQKDEFVRVIHLSRNFGQYPALFAGFGNVNGNYIFVLDCDLEEEPELLELFYSKINLQNEIDVVYGSVIKRHGGIVKSKLGNAFTNFFDFLSEKNVPKNQAWIRLMKLNYVKSLLKFSEVDTFPAGLFYLTGFNQIGIEISKKYKGYSTYSAEKRFLAAFNAIISFSSKPLIYICFLGLLIFLIAFLGLCLLFIMYFIGHRFQVGWFSVIASIWVVGGLIIFCIGVIGLYISRIFNQVKNRPLYLIKSIYEGKKHN
jgi:putative glycosyltransferase